MVIPASMNQIHGGAQLIRLVLTSISALMIKTLQKALAQPDALPRLGGLPTPGQTRPGDAGALKRLVGNSLVPSSRGTPPRGRQSLLPSRLAATAPVGLPWLCQESARQDPWRGMAGAGKVGGRDLRRVLRQVWVR